MIYKLYKNGNVKVLLDMSYDINDIIESLGYCLDCFGIDYSIVECDGTDEKEYAHIRSIEDYVQLRYIDNPKVLKKGIE